MANGDVKLIGVRPSPFVIRARIALNAKAIDYEFLQETFGVKSKLLLKSNPVHKKIPVLIHEGKPICESLIIVEYIDEAWSSGSSLLPSDPYDRAIARFWAAYVDEKWFPTMKSVVTAKDEEQRKASIGQLEEGLALLEDAYGKSSKGKAFFGGDHLGYLDVAFGAFLGWIRAIDKLTGVTLLDEAKTPGLVKWADAFSSDPAVVDVLPETDEFIEFAKALLAQLRGAT